MKSTPTTRWGNLAEAAELKRVSQSSMRRYIAQGLVYAERIGTATIRVDLDSVENMGRPLDAA